MIFSLKEGSLGESLTKLGSEIKANCNVTTV